MGALVSAILSWLFGAFGRLFVIFQMHFTATKILLVTLFLILFPVVLSNLFYEIIEIFLNKALQIAGSQDVPGVLGSVFSFSGLAGYLLAKFKIPESFSVVISAIAVSFTLRSIPFVRW